MLTCFMTVGEGTTVATACGESVGTGTNALDILLPSWNSLLGSYK